jgi:response regulator RpfG family c-di-GMP phosphodiesterase
MICVVSPAHMLYSFWLMNQISKKSNIVLIVDQNVQRRSNVATKVRLMGFSTEVSDSGFQVVHLIEQALETQTKAYSGLIIVEDSEDMPAREVLLLVRNLHKNKDQFPILFLSRNHDPDEILQTIKEGANEYIIDLDNQAKILDKVKKHFYFNP